MHYLLMTTVSVTVVGAFESVGAILVVAMLVVPPATAYLLTDRLSTMLWLSVGLGVFSAVGGYGLARWLDASIAGAMATVAGLVFLAVFFFSPRHGVLARTLDHRRLAAAMSEHLLLLHLSQEGEPTPLAGLSRRFSWRRRRLEGVVDRLSDRGWILRESRGVYLTADGEAALATAGAAELRHRDPFQDELQS
jgi:manganese/zinc/iron transport system permease protein